jgi:4-amino-4-deoxy-L-arabinose transferase-like glycosyltransferase
MDASRYFSQAKYLKIHGISAFWHGWGNEIFTWTDLPLVPFLYGLVLKIGAESRMFIQILTTLFFVGSVLLTYLLGRDLWDEETGLLAGLLLLCQPYLLLHVPLMMVDLPTMFFIVLTVYTFSRALLTGTPPCILMAALAIFCAFWVKYSTWLLLSVLPVIFLVYYNNDPGKTWKRALYTATLAFFLIVPLVIAFWDVIIVQIGLLLDYQRPGLKRWSESFISTFFFQIHPLVSLSALLGIGAALWKKDKKFIIPCYLLLLLILVLQVKRIRYLMPIFPMLALTGAYGLRQLPWPRLQRFLVLSSLGASLVLTFGAFLPFTKQLSVVNIVNSGRFLDTLDPVGAAIYTVPQKPKNVNLKINVPLVDLFTNKKIYFLPGPAEPKQDVNQTSAFRFSWEQKLPDFYAPPAGVAEGHDPLVIISSGTPYKLPPAIQEKITKHRKIKSFKQNTGLFRYKTFVTIYYD